MYRNVPHTRGLTIVELIVVVSLYTILMFAVMNAVSSFYRFNAYTIAQSYQVENARRGMEVLVRDIREMTYADDGAYPLVIKEDNKIGFYSDIDRDDSVEYVEYELLATTTLMKYVYNATGSPPVYNTSSPDETYVLSEYVQNLVQSTTTFSYYDRSGMLASSTTPVTDIAYVVASLIVNIDPIRDPGEFMLRSSAALRNVQ